MIFVCGTDTGCGKTHVAAALLFRLRPAGFRYWKPVQTGTRTDEPDVSVVKRLTSLPEDAFVPGLYSFSEPLSPHRAAELEGGTVSLQALVARSLEIRGPLIVEGAGGLLVPLNREATWLDYIAEVKGRGHDVTVVIAARSGLGTINHSLLTAGRLKDHGIVPAGFIFCGPDNPDNRRTVSEFSGLRDLGCFEFRTQEDFQNVDPAGELVRMVQAAGQGAQHAD